MTWNVPRPYEQNKREISMPSFSRVRENLMFEEDENIEIFFFPRSRPMKVEWTVYYNMSGTAVSNGTGETCLDRSVKVIVPNNELKPGFYDLRARVYFSEKIYEEGMTVFGYNADGINIPKYIPDDFKSFWTEAVKKLEKIDLDGEEKFFGYMDDSEISAYNFEKAGRPEDYDPEGKKYEKIAVYRVNFQSAGGLRFYGWLTVPVGEGPFPGLLVLPGAGINRQPIPAEQARHGFVTLMLQIHPGVDVDMDRYPRISAYRRYHGEGFPENLEDEYFYNVFLGCVQAVRYLKNHPLVDAENIFSAGQSQGGMLAVITAALSEDIKGAVSSLTAFSYWPFREFLKSGEPFDNKALYDKTVSFRESEGRQKYLSYFDTVNFARMTKAPVLILAGMCDRISPVTTVFAVHKALDNRQSRIHFSPNTNHDYIIAFEKLAWRWIEDIIIGEHKE